MSNSWAGEPRGDNLGNFTKKAHSTSVLMEASPTAEYRLAAGENLSRDKALRADSLGKIGGIGN